MSKGFWIIIGIIIAIFGGILLFRGNEANAPSNGSEVQATNNVKGENQKSVTLVEYGDFECSACAAYYPVVEEVFKKYEQDIQFQFRHLPLSQIHKNAFAASRAAEAAGMQDKFWEMYALLYENQGSWSQANDAVPIFEQFAQQLELNLEQYQQDFASNKVNDLINADIDEFKATGERMSTPTFFLDGEKITPKTVDEFSKLIDEAIATQDRQ